MPRRKSRTPNVYHLHVPIDQAAHSSAAHALLVAFVKYLAYARNQCHAPYAQLETHAKACKQQQQLQLEQRGRRRRLPSTARKAIKYYEQLTHMLQLAEGIPYHHLQGRAVAVLLGSSVARPREVYCLHFPAAMHQPGAVEPPAAASVSTAIRKLQRAVLMEHDTVTEWDEPPGATKMWLLFQAPEGLLQAAPEGFTIRRAFNISLRKAFQVNLLLDSQTPPTSTLLPQEQQPNQQPCNQHQQQSQQACHTSAAATAAEAAAAAAAVHNHCVGMEVDDLSQQMSTRMSISESGVGSCSSSSPHVWYQCSLHIKGLKPLPAQH